MGQLMKDAISYASAGRGFLSPRSGPKSVSTQFRQRKECLYRSADAVFLGFPHCKTHPVRFSHLHSLPSRYFLGLLSKIVSFQNT
jgi:hypothetical protein